MEERIESKKINEIIEKIENLKQELVNLQQQIHNLTFEGDINNLLAKLHEITKVDWLYSVIFIYNDNVKYVSEPKTNGGKNVIVINGKIYHWESYDVDPGQHSIILKYYNEYDVPNEILELLNRVPESDIGWAWDYYLKLYCLLQKGYKIKLVKIEK